MNLKTEKNIDAIKQITSHIEDANDLVKVEITEIKQRIKNLPGENLFDFKEYAGMQKEESEIDLGLCIELAEENKKIYNQGSVNTLLEAMEKLKNGL